MRHLCSDGLTSKECGAIFHLIRKIRSLMAEFFSSQSRKRQFPIGLLVRPIITAYDQGPQVRGDDAPARQHRVDPSHVVNTDRIRRDVNPGPNAMFQNAVVSSGAHSSSGREAVGDGEARPGAVSPAPAESPGFQDRPSPGRRDFTTNGRVFRQSNRAQIVRLSHEPVPQSFRQIQDCYRRILFEQSTMF